MSELVKRQQVAAANAEAKSLWEALGVRAAYISWIVGVFLPPPLYFVPGYKKVPFFYKFADMPRSNKGNKDKTINITIKFKRIRIRKCLSLHKN